MRTLLRDSAAGLMHSMIYFGFMVLLGVTTVLEIDHQLPESLKFLHGRTYQAYALVGDLAGVVFTVGVLWAIVRRYVQRRTAFALKQSLSTLQFLATLLAIGITGFGAEAFRIAQSQAAGLNMEFEKWSIVGYPIAQLFNDASVGNLETWHQVMWVSHV
jgi:nitrate reductase gamma subunit